MLPVEGSASVMAPSHGALVRIDPWDVAAARARTAAYDTPVARQVDSVGASSLVDVSELRPHPLNANLFPIARQGEDGELAADIVLNGILDPIDACGTGCASPVGTILAGHRRWRAAIALQVMRVPVVFHAGLAEDEEERRLLLDNRRDQRARQFLHSELYAIEERLRLLLGRSRGYRSDLDRLTTRSPGDVGRRADTNAILAKLTGEKASAIKNRRAVFNSPLATAPLRVDVDAGTLPLSKVASALRRTMKEARVRTGVASGADEELAYARGRLKQHLTQTKRASSAHWVAPVRAVLDDLRGGRIDAAVSSLAKLLDDVVA